MRRSLHHAARNWTEDHADGRDNRLRIHKFGSADFWHTTALDLPEQVNRERRIRGTLHSLPTGRPIEVSGRIGGSDKGAMGCLRNTHNAFRFAAGSMSGDIYARGAFTAMG
jgi:hypothetical protein